MEFYINLYEQNDKSGNRPHYRALMRIDGVQHECAFWPNKDGKAGFSGKTKVKEAKEQTPHNEAKANAYQPQPASELMDDDSPPF